MLGRLFLKLSGKRALFNLNFKLLRFFNSMTFGRLWDFKTNGELEILKKLSAMIDIQVFFDVGANTGEYHKEVSKILSSDRVVYHLFEPSTKTFRELERNLEGVSNTRLNQIALGSDVFLNKSFFSSDTHTLSGFYSSSEKEYQTELVSEITIDQYCKDQNVSEIDFLKIDVEGHELQVLKGGKTLLESCKIKVIQFEFGINSIQARIYFKDFFDLLSKNYDLYLILSGGVHFIDSYYFELESFGKVANYLAVLKSLKLDFSK